MNVNDFNEIFPLLIAGNMIYALEESSEESDSDDDQLINFWRNLEGLPKERVHHVRTKNYLENVVYLYSNEAFKMHFRMNRSTFEHIYNLIGPALGKKINNLRHEGREPISPEKQLLITIWTLATPDSYRSICDRFDVAKSSGLRCVRKVIRALLKFKSRFIKWPTIAEQNQIMTAFEQRFGFPRVMGCVDGTHIKIAAPKQNAIDYINRKGVHSIQLQVTCDNSRKFIHCYAGSPGSMHDSRIFGKSGLQEICNNDDFFPNNSHLLGDSAYCIQPHVMVPYKDNGQLTNSQKNYNHRLSRTRMVIERAIGLLKGRFRILLDRLDVRRTDLVPYYIIVCCILHNICLGLNDHIEEPIIVNDLDVFQYPDNRMMNRAGVRKREEIMQQLQH